MPGVIYDADISGAGVDSMSGTEVIYAVCYTDTVGGGVRPLDVGSDGHVLRSGWISFGDSLGVIGATARDYWRSVWWLDFLASLYTPNPSGVSGTPFTVVASRVQWWLPTGAHAHLYVFGN